MTSRRLAVKSPAEPLTDSATKLSTWLEIPPGRLQADLAAACGVSQQTISDYKRRAARPDPGSELAALIEIATGGLVRAAGWLTAEEVRLRRQKHKRAARFAKLEAGPPASPTSRRRATSRPRAVATLDGTDETEGAPGGCGA
jgi:transcriptional regulator with XRE-family HTH domain